ncbi:MAG: LPXTG cell wall anchor domain-containing protein [Ruminococcus sp.]|nr:LPXTG cell wall anchor domain-containing protein [Ruminococcus sp.]
MLTAFVFSTMALAATPVSAVDKTSDENSMIISYTYENGTIDAVLSANGTVCIGGFEASIIYNKDGYRVRGKTASNSNVLINDIPSKGEIAISMAANENLTDESELFRISFDSSSVPNKSDFSFDISDMYMFNEGLDSDSVAYTISEQWSGFDEASSTTSQSTTATAVTTTTTTTTESTSADLSDNKFVVSVKENKEANSVEVSLSVKGKVEFWTAEGSVKLNISGLDTPALMNAIPDALTSYKEDSNSILFTVVSSSGQNITEEQTIFTYSLPIMSSDYSIACSPQITDICNADYNDVKYTVSIIDDKEPITTVPTSTTTSTTTTKPTTTSTSSNESSTETSSTSQTSSISTVPTTSTATETVTTTEEITINASPYEMSNWAENDYFKKTGIEPYASTYTENEDGTLTITLLDKDGKILDKYTVHSKTGIGFNSNGEEVNLPQTGNNSMINWLIVFGAFILIGLGIVTIKISNITSRKSDER